MSIKLVVTVPDELYQSMGKLAKELGISITEYIRFLMVKAKEQDKE